MKIEQLFDEQSSTYTYLVWDEETRDAVLIDSVKEQVQRDIKLVKSLDLNLNFLLETHIHADHVTGASELRDEFGSLVCVHKHSQSECADLLLEDNDVLKLGDSEVTVLYTPGHTNTDLSYQIEDVVFTGDALLIDGCGRTDFQSGDAATLYESITQKLFSLADDTIVYPGHDYEGRKFSTIGKEKATNSRLGAGKSKQAFIDIMDGLVLDPPKKIDVAVPGNQRCGIAS